MPKLFRLKPVSQIYNFIGIGIAVSQTTLLEPISQNYNYFLISSLPEHRFFLTAKTTPFPLSKYSYCGVSTKTNKQSCVQNIIPCQTNCAQNRNQERAEPIKATISIVVNPFKQSVHMFLT